MTLNEGLEAAAEAGRQLCDINGLLALPPEWRRIGVDGDLGVDGGVFKEFDARFETPEAPGNSAE